MPDSQNTTGTDRSDTAQNATRGFPPDNLRDGTPGLIGKDDFTRQYEIDRLNRGRVEVLVGNIATMQVAGAQVADNNAKGAFSAENLGAPPGIDPKADNVVTPAQHDALKGEWTTESERAGLVEAPAPPKPADNKEPNSVDPTSVSPTVESKSSQSTSPKPQAK